MRPILLSSDRDGDPQQLHFCEAALLVFLSAAAGAWIVAANLARAGRDIGIPVPVRSPEPTCRQHLITWRWRGTALSQPQCNFHVLFVAGDREINGFSPERVAYHVDRLDSFQID